MILLFQKLFWPRTFALVFIVTNQEIFVPTIFATLVLFFRKQYSMRIGMNIFYSLARRLFKADFSYKLCHYLLLWKSEAAELVFLRLWSWPFNMIWSFFHWVASQAQTISKPSRVGAATHHQWLQCIFPWFSGMKRRW